MNQAYIWGYLLLCLVLANLPWLTQRFFVFKTMATGKSFWLRALEWLAYSLVALVVGWALESQLTGQVKDQAWEFYASTLFMFAIMAFPGFIWQQRQRKAVVVVE